jgi:hypothetical protein
VSLPRRRTLSIFALGLALALAAMIGAAPAAHAGPLVASATNCDSQAFERPFARWLDPFSYTLVPGGTFEQGASGWTLSGARVVAGNEPFFVHGADEHFSLALPPGSSATSPSMCVGLLHPTMRFFARNQGSLLSTLRVEVLFEDAGGSTHALPIGLALGDGRWHPTLPFPVLANLLALLPGEHTAVAFRFVPTGLGASWVIDDVYVDPYGK